MFGLDLVGLVRIRLRIVGSDNDKYNYPEKGE